MIMAPKNTYQVHANGVAFQKQIIKMIDMENPKKTDWFDTRQLVNRKMKNPRIAP